MKGTDQFNLVKDILNKTEEEMNKMPPVSILVTGKTGVGKSTLINHLFRERMAETGIGKPLTKHIRKISKDGVPLILYDTRGFELDPHAQAIVRQEIEDTIKGHAESDGIDVVYYCIHAQSARIEQNEVDFIESLAKSVPVIIVLTQSFGEPAKEFKAYIEQLNLHVAGVHSILAKPFPITEDYILPQEGLEDLVARTLELVPEDKKVSFTNAQQGDISQKAKAARRWATRYIASSFGVGFAPIPFSDASLLVPIQVSLLAHITAIFGLSLDKSTLVSLLAGLGGTGSATFLGRTLVSNALKFIPAAGTLVGGAVSGTTAAIVTSALAFSYIEVLTIIAKGEKEGKTFDLADLQQLMKERFQARLKRSKDHPADEKEIVETNSGDKPKKKRLPKWMKRPFNKDKKKR